MKNVAKVVNNQITIEAEGLEIEAAYVDGIWVIRDGYDSVHVDSYKEMRKELQDIIDFFSLDTKMNIKAHYEDETWYMVDQY